PAQTIVSGEKFVPTMPAVAEKGEEQVAQLLSPEASAAGLPSIDDDLATTPAERSALELALGEPAIAASDPMAVEFPEVNPKSDPRPGTCLPFYLKPLEWLNAPLDVFPEVVRGVIGKVALLTLF